MRVDCTATLKRGEIHEEVNTPALEEKLDKISLLIQQLEDLNSLCRGKSVAKTLVSVNSSGEVQGRGYKKRLLSVSESDEEKRTRLVSTISQLLADVLSGLPPRSILPNEHLRFFVQMARQAGMLPLRQDIEPSARTFTTTIDLERGNTATTTSTKTRIGEPTYEMLTQGRPIPKAGAVNFSHQAGGSLEISGKSVHDLTSHPEPHIPSTSVEEQEKVTEPKLNQTVGLNVRRPGSPWNQQSSTSYPAARSQSEESFQRTTHLPLIQRIIINFPPKNSTIGLERDISTQNLMETLDDFALRPISVLKGEKHVNKTAVILYLRIKEKQTGSRNVLKEELEARAREAREEEEREMKVLAESLPSTTNLSRRFQLAYEKNRLKEPDYGIKRVRADFARILENLYPQESACSESVLRLFMLGKYNLSKRTKWLHAIFELCKELHPQEAANLETEVEVQVPIEIHKYQTIS